MWNTNTPKLSYAQHFYAYRADFINRNMIWYNIGELIHRSLETLTIKQTYKQKQNKTNTADSIHFVNLTIQQFFKISFPKRGLAYRRHVGNPRHQILHE